MHKVTTENSSKVAKRKSQFTVLLLLIAVYIGCVVGFRKLSGIFFIYFQETFNANATKVSLAYSLHSFVLFLGGNKILEFRHPYFFRV